MKLNIEFHCEPKDVKRALAILDIKIPSTDEEIIERFQNGSPVDAQKSLPAEQRFQSTLAWVAFIEAQRQEEEEATEKRNENFKKFQEQNGKGN